MKTKIFIALVIFVFVSCQEKTKVDFEQEKAEIIQFLKDYSSFVNKNSIEGLENYWQESDNVSYIPLERDSAIFSFEKIRDYFKTQFDEILKIEYSSWNPSIWINPTKSEATVVFLSSKNIEFKNGFKLSLTPIRNSATLTKFEGKWKLVNLHESVRQK